MNAAKILFSTLFIGMMCHIHCQAQTIYFHYDNAGNRTERALSSTATADTKLIDKKDSVSITLTEVITKKHQTIFYPNASDGLFYISMEQPADPVELFVFDIRGRLVYQNKYDQSQIKLDLSSQPSGVYLVKWRNKAELYTEKVLKR